MQRSDTPAELAKLEALKNVRTAIRSLREQMTDRLLKVSAKVELLLEHLPPKEASHFLHSACEMDPVESMAFVKAASVLKGFEDVLRERRAQFPVMKALASCDAETREESFARMSAGATIGAKDVAAIKSNIRRQKLSFVELEAKARIKSARAKAMKRAASNVEEVDRGVGQVMSMTQLLQSRLNPADRERYFAQSRAMAIELLPKFEATYGSHPKTLEKMPPLSLDDYDGFIGRAHAALSAIAQGRFGDQFGYALDNSSPVKRNLTDMVDCLSTVTSTIPPLHHKVKSTDKPLTKLPDVKLSVIELCAGAGGMSIGLENAGYHPVLLVEFDKDAAATLRKNRPLWNVVEDDLRKVDFKPYRSQRIDLLVGGMPCQPYSIEGKGLGKNDPRDLLLEGARAVDEIRPKAFAFENVAGLLHARHADHLGHVLRKLRRSGYHVQIMRLEAEDFGVPQERTRIIIVGMSSLHMGRFRAPTRFPEWRTNLGDALYELMAERGWKGAKEWADARRDTVVVRNGVALKGALASTVVGRKSGNREKETLRWASKGIHIGKVANHAPTQEEADRAGPGFLPALTLRMRARLQGFPPWWSFVGGKESASRQIGNAVPPVIGSAIGLAVRAAITNRDYVYATLLPRDPAAMVDEFGRLFYPDAPSLEPELGEVMGLREPVA